MVKRWQERHRLNTGEAVTEVDCPRHLSFTSIIADDGSIQFADDVDCQRQFWQESTLLDCTSTWTRHNGLINSFFLFCIDSRLVSVFGLHLGSKSSSSLSLSKTKVRA